MLPQLPDVVRLIQLSILAGAFHTAMAAQVLGQASCPTETALLLRKLYNLGLVEMGPGHGTWRLQGAVRAAAADLAVQLQLPLISARWIANLLSVLAFGCHRPSVHCCLSIRYRQHFEMLSNVIQYESTSSAPHAQQENAVLAL